MWHNAGMSPRSRPRRAAAAPAVALLLLLAPAAAGAAVPSAPVSGRALEATPVALAPDGAGRLVASWRELTGTADASRTGHALAIRGTTGTWGTPLRLPATVVTHALAVTGGRTVAVAAWRQEPVSGRRSRSVITVSQSDSSVLRLHGTRRLDSGPAQRVSYDGWQPTLMAPQVAATPHGGLLVAWLRTTPRERAGVWVASMTPAGVFGRARRLGPGGGDPVLGVAPDGSGVLAWRHGRGIRARLRRPGGAWGPVEQVMSAAPRQWAAIESVSVAATPGRAAVGVLQTERTGAGVWSRSSVHVRDAGTATATASAWSADTLSEFTIVATGNTTYVSDRLRVLVVAAGDGTLRAAWTASVDGHVRAFTAPLLPGPPTAGHGSPVALSPPGVDVALDDAAAGPGARLAVTWFDTTAAGGTISLAEVDAAGAVRQSLALAGERALLGSRVAYAAGRDRPTALWSEGGFPAGYHLVATAPATP